MIIAADGFINKMFSSFAKVVFLAIADNNIALNFFIHGKNKYTVWLTNMIGQKLLGHTFKGKGKPHTFSRKE